MAVLGHTKLCLVKNTVLGHPWLYQDIQGCPRTYLTLLRHTRLLIGHTRLYQDLYGCNRKYQVVTRTKQYQVKQRCPRASMAVLGHTRLLKGHTKLYQVKKAELGHPWLYQDMQGCTMTYVAVLGQTRLQDLHGCTRTYVVVLGHTQAVTKTYKVT